MEDFQKIIDLFKRFWEKRAYIIKVSVVFVVLGFVAALTQKPIYTCSTVFVPQSSSSKSASSSQLSSLAAMAGVTLNDMTTGASLSPLIYPQMLSNINLNKELMATKIHFAKVDEPVSILDYYTDKKYHKGFNLGVIKKYTIGLPFVILEAIKGKPKEIAAPSLACGDTISVFTQKEYKVYKDIISKALSMTVEKKEGYITLTATMPEALAAAEVCQAAYNLLGKYVTDFKIQFAKNNNEYIRGRYEEAKADYEAKQFALAQFTDSNRGVMTATAHTKKDKLMADYQLSYAIFTEISKQLLQSDMKVKEDTPILASVEPVAVPMKKSNSRAKTLVMWVFFGVVLACGSVWGFDYLRDQGINFPKNWY